MIIKAEKETNFAFIDNEGEVFGEVQVSGNNDLIVNSLKNILNVQTGIRFQGELNTIPEELLIHLEGRPVAINKASNLYIKKYFIADLQLQGFSVTIIKE